MKTTLCSFVGPDHRTCKQGGSRLRAAARTLKLGNVTTDMVPGVGWATTAAEGGGGRAAGCCCSAADAGAGAAGGAGVMRTGSASCGYAA